MTLAKDLRIHLSQPFNPGWVPLPTWTLRHCHDLTETLVCRCRIYSGTYLSSSVMPANLKWVKPSPGLKKSARRVCLHWGHRPCQHWRQVARQAPRIPPPFPTKKVFFFFFFPATVASSACREFVTADWLGSGIKRRGRPPSPTVA